MADPQTPPEANVPGSQQGQTGDGKPEHQISGPDGVTPTPDSQAANNQGGAQGSKPPEQKPPEEQKPPQSAVPPAEPCKPQPKEIDADDDGEDDDDFDFEDDEDDDSEED